MSSLKVVPQAEPRPVEQACYWLARSPAESDPPLEGRREAELAVVGAGFTGLWTALHLKRLDPDREVVVLEARRAAHGASGRNAGMLGDTIDHSHELAIAHFGRAEAARLAVLGRANVAELLGFLSERGIDCDLERTGLLHVALLDSQRQGLRESFDCARSLGIDDYQLLDTLEVRAEVHSDRYQGALFNPNAAVLDPVKLVLGLKREARRAGVDVFEGTPVAGIEKRGAGVALRTPAGELVVRRAVLATNAYTHLLLPRLRFRYIPLFDYVLASEPLTPEQRELIGWRGRQGITDVRSFFKYYRLTADDRIVWGTSEAAYYPPNRVDPGCDHSELHYEALRESFARHFPRLGNLAFPYAWGGAIDATTRFTPCFGSVLGGRVLYALGFTGHGLGTTHLAGKVLAHLALQRPSELLELQLVRRKPFPYPPEPLRSWAVAAVTRQLRRVDAGEAPGLLLRLLDVLGIGLSS